MLFVPICRTSQVGTSIRGYRSGMPGGYGISTMRIAKMVYSIQTPYFGRSGISLKTKGLQSRRRVRWIVWNPDESMEHKTPRRGQSYGLAMCNLRGNIRFLVYASISPNSQSRSTTPISRARQTARKSPKSGSLQSGVT
jgi:hypothetical protein